MSEFVAWDGNTYQGSPPDGWYFARDHRWWSPGAGPGPEVPPPAPVSPADEKRRRELLAMRQQAEALAMQYVSGAAEKAAAESPNGLGSYADQCWFVGAMFAALMAPKKSIEEGPTMAEMAVKRDDLEPHELALYAVLQSAFRGAMLENNDHAATIIALEGIRLAILWESIINVTTLAPNCSDAPEK